MNAYLTDVAIRLGGDVATHSDNELLARVLLGLGTELEQLVDAVEDLRAAVVEAGK